MKIAQKIFLLLSAALVFTTSADNTKNADPFPKFDTLKPPVLMRQGAKLTISKEGHFLVDGVPRYLEGTLYYEGDVAGVSKPTYGYPSALNWLYETTQDYKDLQRLGFDTAGTAVPNRWIDKYRKNKRYTRLGVRTEMEKRYLNSGLPVYVDYTCAGWHHGALKYKEGERPSRDAFLVPGIGNNHWVPYSLSTPEGRQLWFDMWTYGARYLKNLGVKPMVYELFNEPDYNDWSDYNRKLFVERMKKKFNGDLAALNRAWHTNYPDFEAVGKFRRQVENTALCIEWFKFMEDLFIRICEDGVKEIRKVDPRPEAGFCVQPLSENGNVNMYEVNRKLNMICSPTGGGDFVMGHFLRAIADGKPIFDGETYMGKTRRSFRNKIWTQYSRGFNASYIFKWSRRPDDPRWKKKDGGKLLAEVFPYMMLNPYAVPPEALLGLMDAKKEIMAVSELFTPRDRGIKREIAVLYSYPTKRLARAAGHPNHNLLHTYSTALEYSQFPMDIIIEEQLAEGRQNRYKVIVAAGVDAVLPETAAHLERFVRNGGILILGQEALQLNEYGFPGENKTFPGIRIGMEQSGERSQLTFGGQNFTAAPYKSAEVPADWRPIAKLDGKPVLFRKSLGKGKLIFLNAKLPVEELGGLVTALLKEDNIVPSCRITDALTGQKVFHLEVTKAQRNGLTGYVLFNRAMGPRLVRFTPNEDIDFCDPYEKKLLEKKDGAFLLRLMPEDRAVVIGGKRAELEKHFGKLTDEKYADAETSGKKWLDENKPNKDGAKKAFTVDPNNIRIIDLRKEANRSFEDRVAGDGKGGWTDQGENCLHGVEWGIFDCNGVPFEFIRVDQNDNRTCIVLGSRTMPDLPRAVRGIKVDLKAKALYFLHAAAWVGSGTEGFRYIVNYADGTKAELPIRGNIEIGDWYHVLKTYPGMVCVPGFVNSQKKGLFVWKWENPHPEKTISSLDIVSANKAMIPILVGLSAEVPETASDSAAAPLKVNKFTRWNDVAVKRQSETEIAVNFSKAKAWAGFELRLDKPFRLPEKYKVANLTFDISAQGGRIPALQLKTGTKYIPLNQFTGKAENGRIPVSVPLKALNADLYAPISQLSFQLIGKPAAGTGEIKLENIRILQQEKEDALDFRQIRPRAWGGVNPQITANYLALNLDDKSKNWCGATLNLPAPVEIPENMKNGFFCFQVNGGIDQWGKQDKGKQTFQVKLDCLDAEGKTVKSSYITMDQLRVDNDPATWQLVKMPLERLVPKNAVKIRNIAIQFQMLPTERCGLFFRNFSLAPAQ